MRYFNAYLTLRRAEGPSYRQWWYWGGEAALRVNGEKMQLKVVGIIQEYNETMQKAGRPYRYD